MEKKTKEKKIENRRGNSWSTSIYVSVSDSNDKLLPLFFPADAKTPGFRSGGLCKNAWIGEYKQLFQINIRSKKKS